MGSVGEQGHGNRIVRDQDKAERERERQEALESQSDTLLPRQDRRDSTGREWKGK